MVAVTRAAAPTPYAGIYTDPETGRKIAATTGAHVLVSCPTGGGKTESVLSPACIAHHGPICGVSSKDDLMQLACERRIGPVYLIDLRQIESPYYGDDIIRCRIDPTALIERHDDALNMATWLNRTAGLSMGGRVASTDQPYWSQQIVPVLAGLLWAASPKGNGQGIDWVVRAVENPFQPLKLKAPDLPRLEEEWRDAQDKLNDAEADSSSDPLVIARATRRVAAARRAYDNAVAMQLAVRILGSDATPEDIRAWRIANGEDRAAVLDDLPPSWFDATDYFDEMLWSVLPARIKRVAGLNDRQRDSVALGMSAAVFPWVYESVRRADLPIFDPIWLNDPTASLFILAEPEGGGVGAALPLVQAIVSMWRRKSSLNVLEHNLLVAIDEATNTLPLPTVDIFVSEARGLGINLLMAVQAAQQIAHRYDPVFMETLLRIFPVMLVMHGSAEVEMLEQGSLWTGLTQRATETVDQVTGNRIITSQEGPRLLPQELQPRQPYRGRLLYRGYEGIEVELPSFEQFLHMFDNQTVEGLVRV